MKRFLTPLLLGLALLAPLPAAAQNAEADNMRILREKMMGDKKLIVAANMALTDAEFKDVLAAVDSGGGGGQDAPPAAESSLGPAPDAGR